MRLQDLHKLGHRRRLRKIAQLQEIPERLGGRLAFLLRASALGQPLDLRRLPLVNDLTISLPRRHGTSDSNRRDDAADYRKHRMTQTAHGVPLLRLETI